MRTLDELANEEFEGLKALSYYNKPLKKGIITEDELRRIAYVGAARSFLGETKLSYNGPVALLAKKLDMDVSTLAADMDRTQREVMKHYTTWGETYTTASSIPAPNNDSWMYRFFMAMWS
jgi:hypothetical protein